MLDMKKINNVNKQPEESKMAITSKGLKFLLVGLLVIVAGNILLMGGGTTDPEVFNYSMFDFRRLYAAPIVIILGIIIEVIAIIGIFRDNKTPLDK